jgi:hypothetical protein
MRTAIFIAACSVFLGSALAADTGTSLGADVRGFADATAGIPGPSGADKVLMFERRPSGELTLAGLAMIQAKDGSIAAPPSTAAILRTRSKNAEQKKRPDAEDRRFARSFGIPVFILGEWAKPATLWEIDPAAPMQFRSIAADGTAGNWVALSD